jgi:hypothetical protein
LLETNNGRLLAGTDGQDIWFRDPEGEWQRAYVSSSFLTALSLLQYGDTLYAGTACCGVFRYTSADDWQLWNAGLPLQARLVTALTVDDHTDQLFAATHGDGVYARTSDGEEWERVGRGLTNQAGEVHSLQYVRSGTDGVLLAGTTAGLYALQDEKWEYVDAPQTDIQYAPDSERLFARTMGGQVWESPDGGTSWNLDQEAPREVEQLAFAVRKDQDWTLFARTGSGGLYYRVPNQDWQQAELQSIPGGKLSIWSYPGLSYAYLQVHVETTDSTALPWSNASFEWQGSAESAPLNRLEGGITVVAADSKDQRLYAGTANNGVHAAQIDVLDAPLKQSWFYIVLGSILLTIIALAIYASRRFGPRLLEFAGLKGKEMPATPALDRPVELPPINANNPPTGAIRDLLMAAFTPKELRRFCQDRQTFRKVLENFGPNHGLNDMVDEVVDYCQSNLLWDELLVEVAQEKPKQFARFRSQLYDLPVADRDGESPSAADAEP